MLAIFYRARKPSIVGLDFHAKAPNQRVGSLNSKLLKSPARICAKCNNERTQPHDRAWEQMSETLRTRGRPIRPGAFIRANRIFPYDTARKMLNVHLYFVKLFGCHVVAADISSIDTGAFADALLKGKPHPNIYLKFGCGPSFAGDKMTGMSDLHAAVRPTDGSCAFATWFYYIDGLAVNVMFATEGEKRDGLIGSWQPRRGKNRLLVADFRS